VFAEILGLELPIKSAKALVEIVRQTELIEARAACAARRSARVEAGDCHGHSAANTFLRATVASVRAGSHPGARWCVLHDITANYGGWSGVRREFVANVSHEFKTPLTAIQGLRKR